VWLNIGLWRKNTKIDFTPVLVLYPKQVKHAPEREFCFYCTVFCNIVHENKPAVLPIFYDIYDFKIPKANQLKIVVFFIHTSSSGKAILSLYLILTTFSC